MAGVSMHGRRQTMVWGIMVILSVVFNVRAADWWDGLAGPELLGEARAAYHLGWTVPGQRAVSLTQPTALDLLDRFDAISSASSADWVAGRRLRLLCQFRLGLLDESTALLSALPENLPDFSHGAWNHQRALWQAMLNAARGDWDSVETALDAIPVEENLSGEAAADLALVRSRLRIRQFDGSTSSYLSLAQAIAGAQAWGIADPLFDPYYAQEDFTVLHGWSTVKQVMGALEGDASIQKIGARRWFEIAAPSAINPFGTLFPDAPAQDRVMLTQDHASRTAAFAPDAQSFAMTLGGYRGLLEAQLAVENLIYCGWPEEVLLLYQQLDTPPQGIPGEIWNAYRLSWRTFGLAGTLAIGEAMTAADQIEQAAALLPPAPFKSYTLGLLGLLRLSNGNPRGNELFAEALRIPLPHPLITRQWVKQLSTRTRNLDPSRVLTVLAAPAPLPGGEAQRLMSRAVFAQKFAGQMPEAGRGAILEQAVTDGALALNLLEAARDPLQVEYRELLESPIVASLRELGREQSANLAEDGFAGTVRSNGALGDLLPELLPGKVPPEAMLRVNSAFADASERIAQSAEGGTAATQISQEDFAAALVSIPESPQSASEFQTASILLNEAFLRGWNTLGLSTDDMARCRLRHAELALGHPASKAEAQAELGAINADGSAPTAVRSQASMMLDALGGMQGLDAYMWAQDWYTFIEKNFTKEKLGHFQLLAEPLADALDHPEVQAFLNDASVPNLVRMNHRYNLAQACLQAGRDEAALGLFNSIIDARDEQEAPDDILRPLAESWRMQIWWRNAEKTKDKAEQRDLRALIVETARQRLTTLAGPDEARINFARWGLAAAKAIKDREAVSFFESKAKQLSATSLF